jgi:multiple sugar transport system ATP-binding protein
MPSGGPRDGVFGGRAIVGIRPEAFEDDAFAGGGLPRIEVQVRVLEELGSDAYVYFDVDADPVVVEEAQSTEEDEDVTLLTQHDRALFAARVDPRTKARIGDTIRLAVDPTRLYFFSPDTGETLAADGRAVAAAR